MDSKSGQLPVAIPEKKARKQYHVPRVEDYGDVNELTRSGPPALPYYSDGQSGYTSGPI